MKNAFKAAAKSAKSAEVTETTTLSKFDAGKPVGSQTDFPAS